MTKTTFKCPECNKDVTVSQGITSEGCTPLAKCPLCQRYIELTSDNVVNPPARRPMDSPPNDETHTV